MPGELHRPTTLHVLHLHPTQNINDAPKSCYITKGAMYARTQPRIRFNVGLRNVRRAPVVGIKPKDRTGTIIAVHRRDPLVLEGRFRSSTGTVGVAVPCEGEGRWKGQTSMRKTSACKHPLHRSIIAELHKAAAPLHLVDQSDPWFIDIEVGGASMLLIWIWGLPALSPPGWSICGMG